MRRGSGTLIYDGGCGFCTRSVSWARRVVPGVVAVPWQQADLGSFGISESAAAAAVQYVDAGGNVASGAEGIAWMLLSRGGPVGVLGRVMLAPGVRRVAAAIYHVVAANRHRLPG